MPNWDIEDTRPPYRFTRRYPTRFERWAWSPILAYRVGLTLNYLGALFFGVSAFFAGVPAFRLTAPEGWTPIWALVLSVGAILAAVGSISDVQKHRIFELLGSMAVFLTLAVYAVILLGFAYVVGDADSAAVGAAFVALGVQPGVRLAWLVSQVGRKTA